MINISDIVYWPPLEEEMKDYLKYFRGNVLNAGAGNRDLSKYIQGKLYNQDIPEGLHNNNIHFYSPLHKIPKADSFFDAIICNAVLEHVKNPNEVLNEFYRVLKKRGYLYLCVPFMQGEHKDPTDFQRFTKDGLKKIAEDHGFSIIKEEGILSAYHTLGWVLYEWLVSKKCWSYSLLRKIIFPIIRYKTKNSRIYVDSIATGYRVLVIKK